jgi:pimeloyl-ACP methyl ester carboxylesterase
MGPGGIGPRLGGEVTLDRVGKVTLVAHSAGYETALALLGPGGAGDRAGAVVLMDALYSGAPQFASWTAAASTEGQRRIVSLYTGRGATYRGSQQLASELGRLLGPDQIASDPRGSLSEAICAHPGVIARSPHPHGAIPGRHLAEVISSLGHRGRVGSSGRGCSRSPTE